MLNRAPASVPSLPTDTVSSSSIICQYFLSPNPLLFVYIFYLQIFRLFVYIFYLQISDRLYTAIGVEKGKSKCSHLADSFFFFISDSNFWGPMGCSGLFWVLRVTMGSSDLEHSPDSLLVSGRFLRPTDARLWRSLKVDPGHHSINDIWSSQVGGQISVEPAVCPRCEFFDLECWIHRFPWKPK